MNAVELAYWWELWQQDAFGERREDIRWAINCAVTAAAAGGADESCSPSHYLDVLNSTLEEIQQRRQLKIECDLALKRGMEQAAATAAMEASK